jgi:hypothetical protein
MAKLALQRWRRLVLFLGVSFVLGGIAYILLPREYHIEADVIGTRYESDITPNNQSNTFSAAALLGGSSNDLPNINDFKLFTQLLISPELGAAILNDPVMHAIYKELWDKDHWQAPDNFVQRIESHLNKWLGLREWTPPDGFTVAKYLGAHVSITANKDAKLITISTWTRDPELGKALITLMCNRADDLVKQMAKERFAAKVNFLEKAMAESNVEETRKALGQALAKAETDNIFSQSDLPFAAEFLAPPSGPTRPQFPRLGITLSIAGGLGFAVFLVDLSQYRRAKISLLRSRTDSIAGGSRGASTSNSTAANGTVSSERPVA